VVTFKNAGVDKTVKELPLESMVLETDAPYLTPSPFRGKRNEPSYIAYVAEKLSVIFDCELDNIHNLTTRNCQNLFKY
jgi:TatD DNase family protein